MLRADELPAGPLDVLGRTHSARINTLGDRAEDVFLVSGEALADPKAVLRIEQELLGVLQV